MLSNTTLNRSTQLAGYLLILQYKLMSNWQFIKILCFACKHIKHTGDNGRVLCRCQIGVHFSSVGKILVQNTLDEAKRRSTHRSQGQYKPRTCFIHQQYG